MGGDLRYLAEPHILVFGKRTAFSARIFDHLPRGFRLLPSVLPSSAVGTHRAILIMEAIWVALLRLEVPAAFPFFEPRAVLRPWAHIVPWPLYAATDARPGADTSVCVFHMPDRS